MTSRRGFIGLLSGAAAALVADPERALWVPGARLISVPAPRVFMSGSEIAAVFRTHYMERAMRECDMRAAAEYQRAYNLFRSMQIEVMEARIVPATRRLNAAYDVLFLDAVVLG